MADRVGSSRIARLGRLGWLSRRALPIAWRRLRELPEDREARGAAVAEALEEDGDVAREALETLGEMKGLALKIGQTLAYMDGVLPARYAASYKKALAPLLQRAPGLPFRAVEPILVADLGRPVAGAFASFDPEPFAAASIGQVHRATLPSGEEVAVKVQYPGVREAIRADLANLSLMQGLVGPLLGLAGRSALGENQREVLAEIRDRLLEETDYDHEARRQEEFRAAFAGDPAVLVPRVFAGWSGPRVLTSEYVRGRTLAEVCASAPNDERQRHAATLTRVMLRSLYEIRLFNADPHPGNYLFPDDGRVALLDFGCTRAIPEAMSAKMKRYLRAAIQAAREDALESSEELDAAITDAFHLNRGDAALFAIYRGFIVYVLRPFLRDEPFEFTAEYTGASIDLMIDGMKQAAFRGGRLPTIPDLPAMPAEFTFLSRLQWGFYSVLTMLGARGNWHRMLPEDSALAYWTKMTPCIPEG